MKEKIIQSIPTLLVLAILTFGQGSYWCMYSNGSCYGGWVSHIYPYFTNPLYDFALYSLPLAIILIFISRTLFKSWFKLAVWLVPLLLLFIATQPVAPQSFLSTNRDDSARLAAQIFTVLSLSLVAWKYYASRRADSVKV